MNRRICLTKIFFERNRYRYFWNSINYKDMHRYKIDIFTTYVISQYLFVASVYCDTNFLWLGSVKACPLPYSNFCFFKLVYWKWKGFWLISQKLLIRHISIIVHGHHPTFDEIKRVYTVTLSGACRYFVVYWQKVFLHNHGNGTLIRSTTNLGV